MPTIPRRTASDVRVKVIDLGPLSHASSPAPLVAIFPALFKKKNIFFSGEKAVGIISWNMDVSHTHTHTYGIWLKVLSWYLKNKIRNTHRRKTRASNQAIPFFKHSSLNQKTNFFRKNFSSAVRSRSQPVWNQGWKSNDARTTVLINPRTPTRIAKSAIITYLPTYLTMSCPYLLFLFPGLGWKESQFGFSSAALRQGFFFCFDFRAHKPSALPPFAEVEWRRFSYPPGGEVVRVRVNNPTPYPPPPSLSLLNCHGVLVILVYTYSTLCYQCIKH